ncbi:histone deacetylase 8-like [Paramuricea clavata]|uniref:histone deacetylase n=1 Tax=Paramuricea clavata TaxID=317549 RepID=A0A6S7G8G8_PARCT|nr:histone deacetylase 8-like [Paramuricea clavata]
MSTERKIAYVYSDEFIHYCNQLPKVKQRASLVHSLIEAYGLLNLNNISIVQPEAATFKELAKFHSKDYITCLQKADDCDEHDVEESLEEFGIGYDCPAFEDFYKCLTMVAGGTLKAVECLDNKSHSIAINWCGGWHHAHRVVKEVNSYFQPDAIVCQCGVDGLAGDPMNSFNLTQYGLGASVHYISSLEKPLLLLGGGGYNFPNAARCWTYITAMVLGKKLPEDIPDHEVQ